MVRAGVVLLTTIAFAGLIYQATSFAMPKLFDSRLDGLVDSTAGIGALVSMIYLVSAAAQILGGWLADRFDLKRVYVLCWTLQIPFLLVAAGLFGPALLPAVAMMVLVNTTAVPAENSLFARYTPPAWRGTAFGVKFLVALGVSAGSVPLVAEMYRVSSDFHLLLMVLAGAAGLGAVVAMALPSVRPAGPAVQPAE